jgi:hypothetical protein
MNYFILLITTILLFQFPVSAKIGNKLADNQKQYGKEMSSKNYCDDKKNYAGKAVHQFPLYGWQVETIYKDGMSFSETVRPKGSKVTKKIITEYEAASIAAVAYPREERGPYRKQVKNAHFISHFYEFGVVSLEMLLEKSKKKHVGVIGVRCIKYSDNETFSKIMIGAYH